MDQQNSSPPKFFDPVILRKSAIVDDGFALNSSFLPLPSIVELSASGTCNRTCSFCPRSDPNYPDVEKFMTLDLTKKLSQAIDLVLSGNDVIVRKNAQERIISLGQYVAIELIW